MDLGQRVDWMHLTGDRHHEHDSFAADDWVVNDRPRKKLRSVQSHASSLRPLVRLVRDPFAGISSIAESLGLRTKTDLDAQARHLQLLRLKAAKSRDEWEQAAQELDRIEGNEAWKNEVESPEYDYELVNARLRRLKDAHSRRDYEEMRFLIRTSLTRDLGGMGDARLYRHTHMGTKQLIEQYIQTVLDVLDTLIDASDPRGSASLDARRMQDQIKQTRQAFGRSALLLSGGGTFGMNHIGVAKCLFEAELLPRIISGASAGSIVASVLCAKTDDEVPAVLHDFSHGPLDVFEAAGTSSSALARTFRLMKTGAIYDIANLKRVMRDLLGDLTFLEAYNRTQRILNICVSTAAIYDQPRLLNYITAPDVVIWSAVAASCSVPGVFSSAQLLVRNGDTGELQPWDETAGKWIDGSVDNDLPMTRLAEMLNVNHFIVSQVNPHVVPFLPKHEDEMQTLDRGTAWPHFAGPSPAWLQTMAGLAKGEALHRLHVMAELGLWPGMMTKVRSVLGQRYSGDITILPELSYAQFPLILSNPTPEFMLQAMHNGEKATWPKLSRIRNHLAVELALDRAVHKLIARVAFSPSQVDVRLGMFRKHNRPSAGRRSGSQGSHRSTHSVILMAKPDAMTGSSHRVMQSWHDRPPEQGSSVVPAMSREEHLLAEDSEGSSSLSLSSADASDASEGEQPGSSSESSLAEGSRQPRTQSVRPSRKSSQEADKAGTRVPASPSPISSPAYGTETGNARFHEPTHSAMETTYPRTSAIRGKARTELAGGDDRKRRPARDLRVNGSDSTQHMSNSNCKVRANTRARRASTGIEGVALPGT